MVNLNRKQRTRAGDFFEKSATGLLVGSALAISSSDYLVVGTMISLTFGCFAMALWIERSSRRRG